MSEVCRRFSFTFRSASSYGCRFPGIGSGEELVQDILFNLILLSGIFAVFSIWWQRTMFIAVALCAFVLRWWVFVSSDPTVKLADNIVSLLYFTSLSVFVLSYVFKTGPVSVYRIQGALVFYLIFGTMCAYVYNIIYQLDPSSFVFQIEPAGTTFFSKFLYFSFVIQTTLGIGDIAPFEPIGQIAGSFSGHDGHALPGNYDCKTSFVAD